MLRDEILGLKGRLAAANRARYVQEKHNRASQVVQCLYHLFTLFFVHLASFYYKKI